MLDSQENIESPARKLVLLLVGIALLGGLSCRRHAVQPQSAEGATDTANAQQRVAEADQHYAEREDLAKVRLAIAMLRQARVADPASYEAAWKLSRASYYLGAHTTDDRER